MGAVNINNTGSGASVALSSDGTSLLLNGTAIGGGGGSSTLVFNNQTAAYTVVSGDAGKIINCSGATSFTVSLTAAATLGSGFNCVIWNNTTTAAMTVTIDPNASETIDGVATLILRRGEGAQIVCDGTNWQTGNKKTMRGYADNMDATGTRPVASGDLSVALGRQVTASAFGAVAIGYLGSASGASSYSFGRSATASGDASVAIGYGPTASSFLSVAIGANSAGSGSQAVTGSGAMALGGSYASGTDSFAAAIANNTSTYGATGANAISIGQITRATGTNSIGIGKGVVPNNTQSVAIGGTSTNSSGSGAFALGSSLNVGFGANSSGTDSFAFGDSSAARETKKIAFAGWGVVAGGAQAGLIVLTRSTTDATATVLTSDTAAASNSNQVILPNNSAYAVTGTVICRQSVAGSDKASGWTFTAVIRRGANAASTALVAAVTPILIAQDVSLSTTVLAVTADTTNGGLAVTVTGIAATNLRWVATIQTSECTYA